MSPLAQKIRVHCIAETVISCMSWLIVILKAKIEHFTVLALNHPQAQLILTATQEASFIMIPLCR